MIFRSPIPFALLAVAAACGNAPDDPEAPPADPQSGAAADLSAVVIDRLVAEYPVLGSDPAPQPQPTSSERTPPATALETVQGEATYYADSFEGRRTASGIPFRQNQFVAAHRGFPFGTLLRVTNVSNDRSVNVRVVDRGPHGDRAAARNTIIDLSRRAAEALGYIDQGRASVRVEVLQWGEGITS